VGGRPFGPRPRSGPAAFTGKGRWNLSRRTDSGEGGPASDWARPRIDLEDAMFVFTIWCVTNVVEVGEIFGERMGSWDWMLEWVFWESTFLISAPVKPVKPSFASVAAINFA
jgi:hypothetical protein